MVWAGPGHPPSARLVYISSRKIIMPKWVRRTPLLLMLGTTMRPTLVSSYLPRRVQSTSIQTCARVPNFRFGWTSQRRRKCSKTSRSSCTAPAVSGANVPVRCFVIRLIPRMMSRAWVSRVFISFRAVLISTLSTFLMVGTGLVRTMSLISDSPMPHRLSKGRSVLVRPRKSLWAIVRPATNHGTNIAASGDVPPVAFRP
mmetsp:Transcript_36192/g.79227  ORF Transcript_36192/g.79227 Transcript_36192/m.79227 type:complete len:200 (-) Transcript_36192:680-1279(-)